jgi:hypothetical protein
MLKLHTRENMSPELRDELEKIEAHERSVIAKGEIDEAIEANIFYLVSTFGPDRHAQSANPFEMRAYWDEPGFGCLMKVDLRTEILEKLGSYAEDDVRDLYVSAAKAFRAFADELEAILEK